LYAYYATPDKALNTTEKELFFSISKTYDLYHYLLALLLEMADFAQRKIDSNLLKRMPSFEDLHPNTRFVDNKIIHLIRKNRRLNAYLHQSKLSWNQHPELVREMYAYLTETGFFKDYISKTEHTFFEEKKFIEKVFENLILIWEDLHMALEEESIYWNDDIDLVIAMILKTLKGFNEQSDEYQPLLPKFKDAEDEQFAKDLLRKSILNNDELRHLIDIHASNWDLDRIALMDILIMQLALTEFMYFPSIPTKVTLNEYIELAKYYSTDKSRNFINGILDKTLKELKTNRKIHKVGRGLIGEPE
jgi:N utilization substance protein B